MQKIVKSCRRLGRCRAKNFQTSIRRRGIVSWATGFLIASGIVAGSGVASAQALKMVTVAAPGPISPSSAAMVAAKQLGFLSQEGLDLDIVVIRGPAQLAQLIKKNITVAWTSPSWLVVNRQPGKDYAPVKFFYSYNRTNSWQIAVPEKSPIKRLQDLKGKKLGIAIAAGGPVAVTSAILSEAGLKPDQDVKFLVVGQGSAAFNAFKTGKIDAINLIDVRHAAMEVRGIKIRRLKLPRKYTVIPSASFAAHEDTIKNDPKTLIGFARAVAKATHFCDENPVACIKLYWQVYPNKKPTKGSEAQKLKGQLYILKIRLQNHLRLPGGDESLLGQFTPRAIRTIVDAFYAAKIVKTKNIPPESIFTNDLLLAINSFDTHRIREMARRYKVN